MSARHTFDDPFWWTDLRQRVEFYVMSRKLRGIAPGAHRAPEQEPQGQEATS